MISILKQFSIVRLLFLAVFDMAMMNFYVAIFSKRLLALGVPKFWYTHFFVLPFIFTAVSTVIYFKLNKRLRPHHWIMIGKTFLLLGFIFVGPSTIFYNMTMTQQIISTACGLGFIGFSLTFNVVPLFPMMMDEIKQTFVMDDIKLNDVASGLYTASFGLGCMIGPVLAAYLDKVFGFRYTTDIFSIIILILLTSILILWKNKYTEPISVSKHHQVPSEERSKSSC